MRVLSLFDGISCGRVALERAGIPVEKYYASEIDKYAIQIAQKNYPDTIQLGDVCKIDFSKYIDNVDLIIGGSPCQGFSFAGKQLNFDDPRSKLFFEFVRAIREIQPKYFLLENVKMKQEFQDVISEHLGVQPIEINSALVSAQNRKRLYWTNIPNVTVPQDKGILLKDIVHEYHGDIIDIEKYCLSEKNLAHCSRKFGSKAPDITGKDKSNTITAAMGMGGGNIPFMFHELEKYIVPFDKTLVILEKEIQRGKIGYFRCDSQANRVYDIHGKAVCLCGDAGGGAAKMGQYLFGCLTPDRVDKRQNGQRFNLGDKFYTLTAQDVHGILLLGYIRKLTPIECERLQTLPDDYTKYGVKKWSFAELTDAISRLPTKILSCAINTSCDLLDLELLNLPENLLTNLKNAKKTGVKEIVKQLSAIALNIIKNGKENSPSIPSNVRFVISQLDTAVAGVCVQNITLNGKNTETLYTQTLGNTNLMAQGRGIINFQMVDGFIELLQKKYSEENSLQKKLYIILTLINLITVRIICSSVKITAITYACIDNLNILQQNLLTMELLGLEMESIIEISDTNRYKALGNGWTVDVIAHLLKGLK